MVHDGVGRAGRGGTPRKPGATFFGIPIDRFGPISSIVIALAIGFMALCASLFLSIIGLMIYDAATHTSMLNVTISYRYIATPVGVVVAAISLVYLMSIWVRRKLAGAD